MKISSTKININATDAMRNIICKQDQKNPNDIEGTKLSKVP